LLKSNSIAVSTAPTSTQNSGCLLFPQLKYKMTHYFCPFLKINPVLIDVYWSARQRHYHVHCTFMVYENSLHVYLLYRNNNKLNLSTFNALVAFPINYLWSKHFRRNLHISSGLTNHTFLTVTVSDTGLIECTRLCFRKSYLNEVGVHFPVFLHFVSTTF